MSSSDFIKGSCLQCGGHLEFPADAVGSTITCPHCGWPTELEGPAGAKPAKPPETVEKPAKSGFGGLLAGVGLLVLVGGIAGGFVYWQFEHGQGQGGGTGTTPTPTPPPVVAHSNAAPQNAPPPQPVALPKPEPKPVAETNDFAVLPYKLEKTPGSSLVYVTGTVRNNSDKQRFGIKVEFTLFDANDKAIGTASDYQATMDPHGEWKFKALVIESKAVAASFSSVAETQ